ncbi:hypothetical protein ORF025L [Spotted knifejaw iridovirus]|nr:hypothetical protein ORF025L [Spotted knifejaw iridovirus]
MYGRYNHWRLGFLFACRLGRRRGCRRSAGDILVLRTVVLILFFLRFLRLRLGGCHSGGCCRCHSGGRLLFAFPLGRRHGCGRRAGDILVLRTVVLILFFLRFLRLRLGGCHSGGGCCRWHSGGGCCRCHSGGGLLFAFSLGRRCSCRRSAGDILVLWTVVLVLFFLRFFRLRLGGCHSGGGCCRCHSGGGGLLFAFPPGRRHSCRRSAGDILVLWTVVLVLLFLRFLRFSLSGQRYCDCAH